MGKSVVIRWRYKHLTFLRIWNYECLKVALLSTSISLRSWYFFPLNSNQLKTGWNAKLVTKSILKRSFFILKLPNGGHSFCSSNTIDDLVLVDILRECFCRSTIFCWSIIVRSHALLGHAEVAKTSVDTINRIRLPLGQKCDLQDQGVSSGV